jgi:hypothetical protein
MEIKVVCECGQKYAFDVEPQNGSMPGSVSCPICGKDGTGFANEQIRQKLAASGPAPATAAPTPAAPGGLRISRPSAPADAPAPPPPDPNAPSAPPPMPAAPAYTRSRAFQPQAAEKPEPKENIPMGLLGGVIAGAVAMVGWYYLTMATDKEFGIVAWLVGGMTGVGVRLLAHDGGPKLGYIAALCACLAILGGKFLVANKVGGQIDELVSGLAEVKYDAELELAKKAVAAKTDAEIGVWLDENSKGPANPARIQMFRSDDQPKMQDFVNGKPSKSEYMKKVTAEASKKMEELGEASGLKFGSRFEIFKSSVDFFTILWLAFGVGSAWRIATG